MLKIKTSAEEKIILRDHAKESSLLLVRLTSQAILMWDNGLADAGVADVVGRGVRQVALWRRAWNKARLASIFTGHRENNNAGKLTKFQLEEIRRALQSPPSEQGIPKEFWDVPTLKAYLSVTFDTVYESPESYYFLLRFSGLSFKYPDTFDRKRDEAFIAERMKAIKKELTPMLEDDTWDVFACDEVRMDQEAIIRKAWLRRGKRTIVKVDRKKQSQSYIGFLNQKSYQCEIYEMPWQNSEEVLGAMKRFLANRPNKKLCVVWDNAPFHKSKAIREELAKGGILERVHLIAMPLYAPDNNPIEHVWNTAKKAVANIQRDTFEDTKQAFSDFVASRLFAYLF